MSLTLDKKIATGMLGRATTGDDLLNVLEVIVATFTKSDKPEPTLDTICF
jgi:hypothetical protein